MASIRIELYRSPGYLKLENMPGYTYILLCNDGSYYTGSTKDVELRLEQHMNGEGANHTRNTFPLR